MTGPDDPAEVTAGDDPSSAADDGEDWPVVESVVEYETEFFAAGYDLVERPDGERARYYWMDPDDVVAVVPVTDEGEVVLVEEYEPQLGGTTLGCPAGGVHEAGETPAEAARRELREETGYDATDLTELLTYRPEQWVRMDCTVFLAEGLVEGAADRDAGEDIAVRLVPVEDAFEAVLAADVVHGAQVAPLAVAILTGEL